MLSLTFALLTMISYQTDISNNLLNSRVFFAYDLENITVSETVRKMRVRYWNGFEKMPFVHLIHLGENSRDIRVGMNKVSFILEIADNENKT
jgi:hypothetical protein